VAGGPAPREVETAPVGERMEPVGAGSNGEHVKASPVAKRLARENNVNIALIKGSGPGGRIVRNDVEQFMSTAAQPAPVAPAPPPTVAPAPVQPAPTPTPTAPVEQRPGTRREPLTRLRQTIARRMVQSKTTVPHFYVTVPIDMSAAMALRKQINALEGVKISVNDMIVKACALTLKQFPVLNASFAEDALEYHDYINISIAVATDNGLLAPAVTDVDKKSLGVIAAETRDLAERTRTGKATPDELGRGTFTVSNLGMFGKVESFVAIVNPPQSAILAVGLAADTPVVKDGQVAIAPILKATISVDHRVGDGAIAAQFLEALRLLLEEPMRLLI
jgi:pyruvate dehydrogenase E2 component (dihydrolipoamide acetyltransferase)